uniref:Uncharacterized protein n=1 Tax=viral metagenome TaxID=1070528 RepID=A0A6C0E4H9_9ZZZZ
MDNKSILAGMIVLLVVVFLTQSKTFNRLIDTSIGRVVLLSMVLLASYVHQLLGVIVVFFIIIMVNKTDILEGFSGGELTPSDLGSETTSYKNQGKQIENVDLRAREMCIQKGKDSKCIPVDKEECTNCENISPSEPAEKFAAF